MTERVFVHIGLPKTATTYLQTIIWSNRDALRERGLVVPGEERRDHLWASRTVREQRSHTRAPEQHRTAWDRIRAELDRSAGTGLISHEFFAAAATEQAVAMVAALAPAEVHLVVTAREPLGLFTASWQESLKNGSTTPMADYGRDVSVRPTDIWNWRTLDLRLVLERWAAAVPPERVHVLVLTPGAPREDVWLRFAGILGVDPDGIDLAGSFPNTSMGVAEAETLRRINGRLEGFTKAFDKGVYLRTFLADERLVPRRGESFWPEPDQVEDCRRRGEAAIEHLRGAPYDVVGELEHLRVPAELEPRRSTTSVTDAEVADVAVDLAATMLGDVRALREARQQEEPGQSRGLRRLRQRDWRSFPGRGSSTK
ncbi:hypothetical protein [Nocardioides mangrovi]|uniref:Sulfotransferase family protein n=1 Tax=Nocardioides mangrovi TaxID=2874580 RepID=A0ABS7U8J9_9ACTN|nr:hypothetical protein [Nocardioides mangrovi]MBZ5737303.1 hypothetical protein [Nocardioides mangrovi]